MMFSRILAAFRHRCASFESRRLCPRIQLHPRYGLGRSPPFRPSQASSKNTWTGSSGDWRKVNEFQKKEGVLVSYHIFPVNNPRNGEPDLVLAAGIQGLYADRAASRNAEEGRGDAAVRRPQGGRGVGRTQVTAKTHGGHGTAGTQVEVNGDPFSGVLEYTVFRIERWVRSVALSVAAISLVRSDTRRHRSATAFGVAGVWSAVGRSETPTVPTRAAAA